MNVILCSAFRNSENYLDRYFEQVSTLERLLFLRGDSLSLVLGYGDCTDDTAALLFEHTSGGIGARLIDVSHGGKEYGSVVDARRFKQAAGVCNKIWAHIPSDADVVIWCESDLTVCASTLIALIDRLKDYPAVAPMVMETSTGGFYDVYAHRKDGVHFQKYEPYFDGWPTTEMTKLTSAGSLLVMNAELARHLIWPEEDVIVGLCRGIYSLGASVWLDPNLKAVHK